MIKQHKKGYMRGKDEKKIRKIVIIIIVFYSIFPFSI